MHSYIALSTVVLANQGGLSLGEVSGSGKDRRVEKICRVLHDPKELKPVNTRKRVGAVTYVVWFRFIAGGSLSVERKVDKGRSTTLGFTVRTLVDLLREIPH